VPIGYIWHREIGLGLDPNARVQEATRLILSRFRQLGSARQAHLSVKAEGVHFPRPSDAQEDDAFDWVPMVVSKRSPKVIRRCTRTSRSTSRWSRYIASKRWGEIMLELIALQSRPFEHLTLL
jgi:hypothetical protein